MNELKPLSHPITKGEGIKKIGLYANTDKPESIRLARECADELRRFNKEVVMLSRQADEYQVEGVRLVPKDEFFEDTDCVIVLGGDGTLLSVARLAAPYQTPLFGINTGKLGFLTEGEGYEADELLKTLIEGRVRLESRMMLVCDMINGSKVESFLALNDVVIRNGGMRMMEFFVQADEARLGSYRADGLIITTPTGSTAYSLAAGGPIIHPSADVMAITPIAPQHLHDRPTVLPGDTVLEMHFSPGEHSILVSMDGQKEIYLNGADRIRIRKSPYTAKLIRLDEVSIYDRFRKKLFFEE